MYLFEKARQVMQGVYRDNGRCTIACDCGSHELALDGDMGDADFEQGRLLIEHAAFEHTGRRSILVHNPAVVFNTADLFLDEPLDFEIYTRELGTDVEEFRDTTFAPTSGEAMEYAMDKFGGEDVEVIVREAKADFAGFENRAEITQTNR